MLVRAVVAAALALAALTAAEAQAVPSCPTVSDPAGDTRNQVGIRDDASDLTAVEVSSTSPSVTVQLTVVGTPSADEAAGSRIYDVYLDTGEGGYALEATLGMGTATYRLMAGGSSGAAGGSAAFSYKNVKDVAGRHGEHTVTMTAALDKDMPLRGRRVEVSARTWRMAGGSATVAGQHTPDYGVTASLDDTNPATFRMGDAGCPPREK